MNWLHFFLWVAGIYTLYYLVNILFDISQGKHVPGDKTAANELTFSDEVRPVSLLPGTDNRHRTAGPEPEVVASGGVRLKDLFGLVRRDAIVYTRAVSF